MRYRHPSNMIQTALEKLRSTIIEECPFTLEFEVIGPIRPQDNLGYAPQYHIRYSAMAPEVVTNPRNGKSIVMAANIRVVWAKAIS